MAPSAMARMEDAEKVLSFGIEWGDAGGWGDVGRATGTCGHCTCYIFTLGAFSQQHDGSRLGLR